LRTTTLARLLSAVTGVGAVVAIGSGLSGHAAATVVVVLVAALVVAAILAPVLAHAHGNRFRVVRLLVAVMQAGSDRNAPAAVVRASTLPGGGVLVVVRYRVTAINRSQAEAWLRAALAVPAGAAFETWWADGRTAEVTVESRRA
jgi:hypothetical protein